MKKDAYYFPHFSNARNDSKLIKLRRVLGIEGYGIYFMLLEILREQTEFRLPISGIEDLAYEWHTSREKIISVINDFGLFEIIDNEFFSSKLILYLQPYIEKSERARIAAKTRWDAVKSNANAYANALPEHSASNASKGEESKREESKVNEKIFSDEIKNFTHSILKHFPTKPKKIESWYKITEDLVNLDQYNYDSIRLIVETFTADGNFWKPNFQSYAKLRNLNKDKIKYVDYFKNTLIAEKNGANKGINSKKQGTTPEELQAILSKHFD